jgi:hypothetical protein
MLRVTRSLAPSAARARPAVATKHLEPATALDELRALESKPPKRANQLLARHLECEESLTLSHMIAEAARRSSNGSAPVLEAPTQMLPPLA